MLAAWILSVRKSPWRNISVPLNHKNMINTVKNISGYILSHLMKDCFPIRKIMLRYLVCCRGGAHLFVVRGIGFKNGLANPKILGPKTLLFLLL